MGPIQFIVQCHWDYTDSNCPVSPSDPVYDWECDPRSQTCADDQYQMAEMSVAKMSNDFVQIEEVEEEEEEEEEQEEEPEYESEEHSEDYDQEPTKIKVKVKKQRLSETLIEVFIKNLVNMSQIH